MNPFVQVAMVGAGNMGGGMLSRLCGLGWSVAVHDTDPLAQSHAAECGAVPCGSAMPPGSSLSPDQLSCVSQWVKTVSNAGGGK